MAYQVRWVKNRKKEDSAAYKSNLHPDNGYSFVYLKRASNGEYAYYQCSNCRKVAKMLKSNNEQCPSIPSIKISGDYFRSDPDQLLHICIGNDAAETAWSKIVAENHYL